MCLAVFPDLQLAGSPAILAVVLLHALRAAQGQQGCTLLLPEGLMQEQSAGDQGYSPCCIKTHQHCLPQGLICPQLQQERLWVAARRSGVEVPNKLALWRCHQRMELRLSTVKNTVARPGWVVSRCMRAASRLLINRRRHQAMSNSAQRLAHVQGADGL